MTYTAQFLRFLPVLIAVGIFIGLGLLFIWISELEKRKEIEARYNERIAQIESEAEQVFGNSEQARMWLQKKNIALGSSPISMLDSDAGANEVRKVLASITHGGVV